jgi:hypothetical protein
MKRRPALGVPRMRCLIVVLVVAVPAYADDATIVDASGKEIALKKWSFSAGVVKPAWLGKDALAFRETNSTTFRDGVITYIPLERLESLTYDAEKQTVKAKVAGVEAPLEGWTRYQGINQLAIAAEVDKGAAGVVELKYHGGGKGGIKSIKFAGAKSGEAPKGEPIYVVIGDGKKPEAPQVAHNLQALYRADKTEKLLPTLMFKKTYRVDLGQVKKMTVHEQDKSFECEVTLKDGTNESLTLVTTIPFDVHTATLEGLVADVPAGYKLFPMHTIAEINREAPRPGKEKK